jgi:hypothetical protein
MENKLALTQMFRLTYVECNEDHKQIEWYSTPEEAYSVFNQMTDDTDDMDFEYVILDTIEFDPETGNGKITATTEARRTRK